MNVKCSTYIVKHYPEIQPVAPIRCANLEAWLQNEQDEQSNYRSECFAYEGLNAEQQSVWDAFEALLKSASGMDAETGCVNLNNVPDAVAKDLKEIQLLAPGNPPSTMEGEVTLDYDGLNAEQQLQIDLFYALANSFIPPVQES